MVDEIMWFILFCFVLKKWIWTQKLEMLLRVVSKEETTAMLIMKAVALTVVIKIPDLRMVMSMLVLTARKLTGFLQI